MKKFIFLFIFCLSFIFVFGSIANAKVLIAYFTLSGNTEKVAKNIQKAYIVRKQREVVKHVGLNLL